MDWFLYDNGLCHERVKQTFFQMSGMQALAIYVPIEVIFRVVSSEKPCRYAWNNSLTKILKKSS